MFTTANRNINFFSPLTKDGADNLPTKRSGNGQPNGHLKAHIEEQKKVNGDLNHAPGAAMNQTEDVIQTKEALYESEKKYRTLFESMDEGYIMCDVIFDKNEKAVDIRYLEANAAAVRMTGTELVGKTTRELNVNFEQYWFDTWGRVAKTGIGERHEYRSTPLGVWYNFYVFKVGGLNDTKVAAVYEDISERKNYILRQDFLLKLSDALRPKADPVEVQKTIALVTMNHFKSDRCFYCELEGDQAIVHRDVAKEGFPSVAGIYSLCDAPVFKKVVDTSKPFIINDVNTSPLVDESLRQSCIRIQVISFIAVPVIKEGVSVGLFCIVQTTPRNWTQFEIQLAEEVAERTWAAVERAKIEKSLLFSEELNRIALVSAEMGAWDWHVNENKVECNEQYYNLLGIPQDNTQRDLISFLQYVHPDDQQRVEAELNNAVEHGIFHSEFRIIRVDNQKVKWMNGYGRRVANDDKSPMRIVGVIYDITQRKIIEQQKDDFIGIASHELKTPLTSIKVYAELLCEIFKEKNDTTAVAYIKNLDAQIDRITDLVRKLLDMARISEGQLKLNQELFDMNELIDRQVKDLKFLSRGHELVFKPGKLKMVRADKERIAQVITNFLSNAIKYSPKGGQLLITSEDANNGIRVSVRDEGMGIPYELSEKIFDRFFRVSHPTLPTFPGMGMGLYIARNIIQQHKGTIGVESEPGKGSEFYFFIPYENGGE